MLSRIIDETIDARQVAACRILLAVAALLKSYDLAVRLPRAGLDAWPVWLAVWDVAALLLLAGIAARTASVVLVGMFLWFIQHGQYANHFAFLAISVALLVLVDSSARWSLRERGPDRLAAWPVRLIQLNLLMVYLFAGLSKVNPNWASGNYLAVRWQEAMLLPGTAPLWVAVLLGSYTIAWEVTAPIGLVWRRTRGIYLALGVASHLGMMIVLSDTWTRVHRLGVFALAIFGVYVLFLDERHFIRVTNRLLDRS